MSCDLEKYKKNTNKKNLNETLLPRFVNQVHWTKNRFFFSNDYQKVLSELYDIACFLCFMCFRSGHFLCSQFLAHEVQIISLYKK